MQKLKLIYKFVVRDGTKFLHIFEPMIRWKSIFALSSQLQSNWFAAEFPKALQYCKYSGNIRSTSRMESSLTAG